MKAMFISDLLVAKKYILSQIGISVIVGLFICYVMENLYVVAPAIGATVPFSLAFSILAFDERDNWQQFRLSLPLSRKEVILGRYASLAVFALGSAVLGLVVLGLVILAATIAPSVPLLTNPVTNIEWQSIVLAITSGIALIFVMLAITLPMVSRFGMTKAVRFIPLVVVFGMLGAFAASDGLGATAFFANLVTWLETPAGTMIAAAVIIAAAVALYAASCALSVKLYQAREF